MKITSPLFALVLASAGVSCEGTSPATQGGAVATQSHELRIPSVVVGTGSPTGTYFNGTLWLAYTAKDGFIHTLQRSGSSFIDRKTIFISKDGPSLSVYNGKLFLTWVHGAGNRHFAAAKSADGVQWVAAGSDEGLQRLKHAPGMVVYGGALNAFITHDSEWWPNSLVEQLIYNEVSNIWHYGDDTALESTIGPSAAVLGNDLFVAAVDGDGAVLIQKYVGSVGWQTPNYVSPTHFERGHLITATGATPSLLLLGSQYGNVGPDHIRFDRSFNGVNMENLGVIQDKSGDRPHGIRADDSSVELVFKGTNKGLYVITVGLPVN